jgi:hypothetical protein
MLRVLVIIPRPVENDEDGVAATMRSVPAFGQQLGQIILPYGCERMG